MGRRERKGYGGGGRESINLSLHCHHRKEFALRWAAMRAILMFHNCEEQSQDSVHRPQLLKKKESRNGFEPKVPLLTSLTPYRWARPAHEADRQGVLALYDAVRPTRLLHRHLRHSTRGDHECKPQAHEIFTRIQTGSDGITGEDNTTPPPLSCCVSVCFRFRSERLGVVVSEVAE